MKNNYEPKGIIEKSTENTFWEHFIAFHPKKVNLCVITDAERIKEYKDREIDYYTGKEKTHWISGIVFVYDHFSFLVEHNHWEETNTYWKVTKYQCENDMDIREIKKKFGAQFSFAFDFINSIVKYLELNKNARILDVGTGIGRMAIILALNDYKVITGEPEGDNPEYGQQDWLGNAKKFNVDHLITFKYFKAENLPFKDNYFDAIFCMGVLHHIEDITAAFSEFSRTLKPNGTICVFEPTPKVVELIRIQIGHPSHPGAVDPRDYIINLPLSVKKIENPMYNAFIISKK